jgi:hypothetical protein
VASGTAAGNGPEAVLEIEPGPAGGVGAHSKESAEAAMFVAPVLAAQQVEVGEVFREGVVVPVEEEAGVAAVAVVGADEEQS